MRRGEVIALYWSDIDFEHSQISITKSTGIVNGKAYTKEPKNKNSIREISVPGHIMDLLRRYRIEYKTYRISIGAQWIEHLEGEYIFIQWNGLQMYPSTPYNVFKKIIHAYNETHEQKLPEITLHGLRHTSATLLISENADIRTVSN
ncbi:site-specific integrase [bacterium D16-51]|nr:site-specific integrase [bacterium D16-59]RKI58753.1 site-specific integrase [bacterium D16-51]